MLSIGGATRRTITEPFARPTTHNHRRVVVCGWAMEQLCDALNRHDYEPHLALYAGSDGLDAHREIISQASDWLATDGWLVLEIGHDQGASVRELLNQNGFGSVEIRQDYSQRDRIALARKN